MTSDNLIGRKQLKVLQEYMDNEGLSQKQMAIGLGLTRQYFNLILNRNKKLTYETALKLEKVTGVDAQFWLGEQGTEGEFASETIGAVQNPEKSEEEFKLLKIKQLIKEWKDAGSRDLTDHEIHRAVKNGYLTISPFNPHFLEPISYRLRSDKILLAHDKETYQLNDEEITIQKNQKVAIMTKERLHIPRNISATVTPTTKIIDEAVNLNSGFLVHPGYRGRLFFTLNNLTNRPITLKKDVEFLRIKFTFLKIDPERVYEGSKQDMADFPKEFKDRFCNVTDTTIESDKHEEKIDLILKEIQKLNRSDEST